ncbi:hypothetical protein V6N12_066874 [Hibiscus sabdariffa]|uniref:Uncharacterized protein n=1 Tax=Hibiscus sabdariffa TaxID=183260 RepID=A0ABR2C9D7_9ROSI
MASASPDFPTSPDSPASPDFPAEAENYPPRADFSTHVVGSRFSANTAGMIFFRQGIKLVTCRDSCQGRPGQEIQSGVRLDQHIFLSMPVQRACQIEAEKIAKAGSQAHA